MRFKTGEQKRLKKLGLVVSESLRASRALRLFVHNVHISHSPSQKYHPLAMLKEIQCLNAIAITAMETQDYREAAEALKHALSELSSCVLEPSPLETEGVISDLGDDCIELEAVLTPCLRSPSAANGDFYHYPFSIESERVFKVEADERRASHLSREEHARCTIACFYNLALCHQLQWLKTVDFSKELSSTIKTRTPLRIPFIKTI